MLAGDALRGDSPPPPFVKVSIVTSPKKRRVRTEFRVFISIPPLKKLAEIGRALKCQFGFTTTPLIPKRASEAIPFFGAVI